MNNVIQFERRVSRSRSKHEGEPSASVCDRLSRTRVSSQRQLPTDHDYAVPTREYQLDQSSPLSATAAADPALELQRQKQPQRLADIDRVTPYQLTDSLQYTNDAFQPSQNSQRPRAQDRYMLTKVFAFLCAIFCLNPREEERTQCLSGVPFAIRAGMRRKLLEDLALAVSARRKTKQLASVSDRLCGQ